MRRRPECGRRRRGGGGAARAPRRPRARRPERAAAAQPWRIGWRLSAPIRTRQRPLLGAPQPASPPPPTAAAPRLLRLASLEGNCQAKGRGSEEGEAGGARALGRGGGGASGVVGRRRGLSRAQSRRRGFTPPSAPPCDWSAAQGGRRLPSGHRGKKARARHTSRQPAGQGDFSGGGGGALPRARPRGAAGAPALPRRQPPPGRACAARRGHRARRRRWRVSRDGRAGDASQAST